MVGWNAASSLAAASTRRSLSNNARPAWYAPGYGTLPLVTVPMLVLGTANRKKGIELADLSGRSASNCGLWPIFRAISRWKKTATRSPPTRG